MALVGGRIVGVGPRLRVGRVPETDLNLLVNPRAESKVRQGVTTEVTGQDGSSVGPWTDEEYEKLRAEHRARYGVDIPFRDLTGFFRWLDERGAAVHVASMGGRPAVRRRGGSHPRGASRRGAGGDLPSRGTGKAQLVEVYEGRDYHYMGETNTTYNPQGHFLISVLGNYNLQEPTPMQIEAITDLMAWAVAEFNVPLDRIYGHATRRSLRLIFGAAITAFPAGMSAQSFPTEDPILR